MTAKIRELNLDDLNNVSGGVTLVATASRLPASTTSVQAGQFLVAPSRPTTSIQPSVSIEQLLARRA